MFCPDRFCLVGDMLSSFNLKSVKIGGLLFKFLDDFVLFN